MHFFGHSNPLNHFRTGLALSPSGNKRASSYEQREYHSLFFQTVILSTSSLSICEHFTHRV
ncbi:MAG TPA: hypothetical protein DCQ57_03395 [Enterobacteriaceae bacterium]|nr:hypothetical protein [Enterobacteriaceae bacterium]HAP80606.1 hypothetical protein [Enterobacteriaceae bacterium]